MAQKKRRKEIASSGYVAHSLEAALWWVASTADFKSAILKAANLGEDRDTTAAIAGQLAGALYGVDGIPRHWLGTLAEREPEPSRLEIAGQGQSVALPADSNTAVGTQD
jgi:ADP-ribosylglycohydrolase